MTWQSMDSALPAEGTVVIVYRGNESWNMSFGPTRDYIERCDLGWYQDGRWWQSGTGHDFYEHWAVESGAAPTHWMPLPEPPETEA